MKKLIRIVAALGALALSASLAACGGSSGGVVGAIPGVSAQLRFVNGAPSAGAVTWYIDGGQQDQNVPASTQGTPSAMGSITTYKTTGAKQHSITFTNASGSVSVTNTCNSASLSLASGSRNTVVLVGNGTTAAPYQCEFFNEPSFSSSTPSVIFHHAALLAVTANSTYGQLYAGYQTPANSGAVQNLGTFSNPTSTPPGPPVMFTNIVPQASGSGGISFAASSSAGGTPLASITPSQVDPSNTGNVIPFGTADTNLSIYLLDNGSGGMVFVGTFTP